MTRIITGHQPVYLPWLGLFHKIALSDAFVFMDDVQYLQKDWNNRNKIKTPNGSTWLTVPVRLKESSSLMIKDILVHKDNQNPKKFWQTIHWKSIETSYRKSPYFMKYADFFHDLYIENVWDKLSDLNEAMLRYLLGTLDINTEFIKASEYGFEGKKSDLVLDHCLRLNADICVTGTFGKDYIDVESFHSNGVRVYFQDYNHPVYPQRFGEFLPYLSIVDLLFNCGERSREIIMSGNIAREELLAGAKQR